MDDIARFTQRYGPVDVERWQALAAAGTYLHVFVDGEDVTLNCRFADDVRRTATLFRRDAAGRAFLENGAVAVSVVTGSVEIRQGAPL